MKCNKSTPVARGKVYRLGEWSDEDIPDPYRQPEAAFKHALNLIEQGIVQWIPKLK